MNKNQWYALGFLFLTIFPLIWSFIFCYPSTLPEIADVRILFIFFIISIACWVCGWLEKEEAK